MKAYSLSQGKVIDVPDNTQVIYRPKTVAAPAPIINAPSGGGVVTSVPTGGSTGGLKTRDDILNAMKNDPKNIQKYKVLLDLLPPDPNAPAQPVEQKLGSITAQQAGLAKAGLQNIQKVKELYLKDPNLLTKQLMPGKFLSREFDAALYDTADTILRLRTGAQANAEEIQGYMQRLAPSFGDSPQVAAAKIKQMENDLKIASGQDPNSEQIDVSNVGEKKTGNQLTDAIIGNPLSNFLLGKSAKLAQDVGAGARVGMESQNVEGQQKVINDLLLQGKKETDPAKKLAVYKQIQELNSGVGQQADQLANSFSGDVNQGYLGRSLGAATEVAGAAELGGGILGKILGPGAMTQMRGPLANNPDVLSGVLNKAKEIANPGGRLSSTKTLGLARDAAAKDIPVDAQKIVEAGDKYVSEINPAAKKVWETLKPAVEKTNNVPDLLEKLTDWGSKAYTKSGDVRAITEGQLKNYLYQSGRSVIKDAAPKVADLTAQLANRQSLVSLLNKIAVPSAVSAGAGLGAGALISTLLNRRR